VAATTTPKLDRRRCDMYSLGVVLWEIFSLREPFADLPRRELMKLVCFAGRRPEIPQLSPCCPLKYVKHQLTSVCG
jgi:serine/threonine protein kinase